MPSNKENEDQFKARRWLDKSINESLKNLPDGIHLRELIYQVCTLYPVKESWAEKWIKDYIIYLGYVDYRDDILYYKK